MGALLPLTLTLTLTLTLLSTLSHACACNITAVLEVSECKMFASLISDTGVIKSYLMAQKGPGLTIFAPSDDALKEPITPDLSKLTNAELVSLLQYHALAGYTSKETIKTMTKDPIRTLASNPIGKYDLTVRIGSNDDVVLETGVDSGKIIRTAFDEAPVSVFIVDRVLLPEEIFGNATLMTPEPAPAPDASEADAPVPGKSGAEDVGVAGVLRAVLAVATAVTVMVFLS